MFNNVAFLLGTALMYGTPLLYAALGGVMSENSGVINIGLEGIMTLGAFVAAWVAFVTGDPMLALLAAGVAGALLALILAVSAISFHGNQVIAGTAINFIGPGIAIFLSRLTFEGAAQTKNLTLASKLPKPLNGLFPQNSAWGMVFNQDVGVYIAILLTFLIWFLLYKTRFGLRVRSCGEHPHAAATLGIGVVRIRYICVLLSGMLGGFGGASMSIAVASNFFPALISGHGFIALAAMIFGRWKPQGALGACFVFGFAKALVVLIGGNAGSSNTYLLSMLPYIITLVILLFTAKNSAAPAADGLPYYRE